MSFFSGFLGGFSEVGSEIIQREDAQKQRINEIAAQGDVELRNSLAKIKADAEAQAELQRQLQQQQMELFQASGLIGGVPNSSPSVLQMPEAEVDIETGEPVAPTPSSNTAFTGMAGITPIEIVSPNSAAALSIRQLRQLEAQKEAANIRAGAVTESARIKTDAAQKVDLADAWDSARNAKDSDVATTLQSAGSFPVVKEQIQQYREASKNRGVDTALGSLVSGFLRNGTLDTKLLEEAGVTAAVANAKDLKPVSNDEIKMLKSIAPNPDNVDAYNQFLFTILEYKAARAAQKADFYLAAKEQGLRPLDAELKYNKWEREYIKDNPYFAKDKNTNTMGFAPGVTPDVIAADDSWKTVLGLTPTSKPARIVPVSAGGAAPTPAKTSRSAEAERARKALGL